MEALLVFSLCRILGSRRLAPMLVFWHNLHPAGRSESNKTLQLPTLNCLNHHQCVYWSHDAAPLISWWHYPKRSRTDQTWTDLSTLPEKEWKDRTNFKHPYVQHLGDQVVFSHLIWQQEVFFVNKIRQSQWKCTVQRLYGPTFSARMEKVLLHRTGFDTW